MFELAGRKVRIDGKRCLRRMGILSISFALIFASFQAYANEAILELLYDYPCAIHDEAEISIHYDQQRPVAFGVQVKDRDEFPSLTLNEDEALEQPFEMVAFEYFSACEQAGRLLETGDIQNSIEDPVFMEDLFSDSDCSALSVLEIEGLLGGLDGYFTILNILENERANQDYFGVLFSTRAENIGTYCPM